MYYRLPFSMYTKDYRHTPLILSELCLNLKNLQMNSKYSELISESEILNGPKVHFGLLIRGCLRASSKLAVQ